MDKIQNIEAKIDKIILIQNQLYNQLYLGYCSFVLTNEIQLALVDRRIVHMQELLKTVYFACGNSTIIVPRTVVEEGERKENININFLFREWEETLNLINKTIKKRVADKVVFENLWQDQKKYLNVFHRRVDILNSVIKDKHQLKLLEPTLTLLEEKRSNYVAHISKKLLRLDRIEQPVYTNDLNNIYQKLFSIIMNYYELIGEEIVIKDLATLQGIVENDFSLLMKSSSSSSSAQLK